MQLDDLFDEQKQIAGVLIKQGARAVIVSHETGLAAAVTRRLYKHLKKEPSPSGLLPDSIEYFFSGQNRTHSSAFWRCYKAAQASITKHATETKPKLPMRGKILAVAYDHYQRICGGAQHALPIDRMWHLTRVVRSNDQIIEAQCRVCSAVYLTRNYETGFVCERCEENSRTTK